MIVEQPCALLVRASVFDVVEPTQEPSSVDALVYRGRPAGTHHCDPVGETGSKRPTLACVVACASGVLLSSVLVVRVVVPSR